MHGTKGCSIIQYMALMLFVLQCSMLLLLQRCQICPLSCKPMCFVVQYCTQMVQLTRLHNIRNLHKTSLLFIDAYHQTESFFSAWLPQERIKPPVTHHDSLPTHLKAMSDYYMGLSLAFDICCCNFLSLFIILFLFFRTAFFQLTQTGHRNNNKKEIEQKSRV